jgi:uncharacterized membrane protein
MFNKKSERGQALILIVFAIIGLVSFAGLAVDGTRVYTNRRGAQNAADAAVLQQHEDISDQRPGRMRRWPAQKLMAMTTMAQTTLSRCMAVMKAELPVELVMPGMQNIFR